MQVGELRETDRERERERERERAKGRGAWTWENIWQEKEGGGKGDSSTLKHERG